MVGKNGAVKEKKQGFVMDSIIQVNPDYSAIIEVVELQYFLNHGIFKFVYIFSN